MTGIGGDGTSPLGGDNRLLIGTVKAQMQRMSTEHTEELYGRIKQLEKSRKW